MAEKQVDDVVAEQSFEPTFYVPEGFFTVAREGDVKGNWLYKCTKCVNKLVSVNYKSRSNLKNHVRSKHSQSLEKFVQQCQQADKCKRPSTDDSIAVVKGINTTC